MSVKVGAKPGLLHPHKFLILRRTDRAKLGFFGRDDVTTTRTDIIGYTGNIARIVRRLFKEFGVTGIGLFRLSELCGHLGPFFDFGRSYHAWIK